MTFAGPFYSLRVRGHLGGSSTIVENWNYGFKIGADDSSVPSESTKLAFLTALQSAASTFHAAVGVGAGSNCFLTSLTCAKIGTDGHYVGGGAQATTVYTYGSPVSGSATGTNPYATSFCIGLRTAQLRGLASNGRVYIPVMSLGVTANSGQWSTTQVANMLSAAKTFLNAINTAAAANLSDSHGLIVASQGGQAGGPASFPVTGIRGDGRPDHNETREKGLISAYQTLAL